MESIIYTFLEKKKPGKSLKFPGFKKIVPQLSLNFRNIEILRGDESGIVSLIFFS